MKTKFTFLIVTLAVLATAPLLVKRIPQPTLFCDECVMRRDVTEWRLVGRWKLFQISTTRATPVSELLAGQKACPVHEHTWSAPQYVAEADLETSEAPRVRSLGFLNEPRSVNFLHDLFDYAGSENISIWRAVVWQPLYASALEPALRFRRFPENGFANRCDFLAWWNNSAYPVFNKLHEMTEAD